MTIRCRVDKNQKRQEEPNNKVEETSKFVNQSYEVQSGDSVRERISKSLWVHAMRLRCLEGDIGVTRMKRLNWTQSISCVCKEDKASRDGDEKRGPQIGESNGQGCNKANHKGMVLRAEEGFQDCVVGRKRKERQRSC